MDDNKDTRELQEGSAYANLPTTIFIIPMRGCPIFPGLFTTIEVSDKQDIDIIRHCERYNGFGLLLLKNDAKDNAKLTEDDFYKVGTFVRVKNQINTIYGTKSLFLETICRFKVDAMFINRGVITAQVTYVEEDALSEVEDKAFTATLREALDKRSDRSFLLENLRFNASNISEALRLADYLASAVVPRPKQQDILETFDGKVRIMKVLKVLAEELAVQHMHDEIQGMVSKRIDSRQREYFLREELRYIKKQLYELGHSADELDSEDEDGSSDEAGTEGGASGDKKKPRKPRLIDRLKALNLTGETYETVMDEYQRMSSMDTNNPEYSMTRTYLELIADLPWNTMTPDDYSLERARDILEKDHYGIKDVKDRILEFLAVRKLKNDTKGSIICLVGPPGTGKTSIGISIAKALNKKYYRFSVGGMRDEAEIKGHRRTYIGSMPGQIIKGLRVTKSKNPVFVIDEVDKMTVSAQGDPASALLEVLDPEQNSTFRDHYLDVPFDVSNVLFIVTANTTDTIPRPLLDRMEVIELSGYTSDEKLHIGKKYLVPKSRAKHGLKASDIQYTDKMLRKIAEEYAREAGVRNFEKALDKIHRKVAMEIVQDGYKRSSLLESGTDASAFADMEKSGELLKRPVRVSDALLLRYLGQPIFHEDEVIRANKVGMSVGLAWTSMGGDVLAIEAQHIPGRGELKITGQLGDVMQESANIAFSYVKSICASHGIDMTWFDRNSIHLHVPEGATPKDGPSAGITMATAIYSLITGQVMAQDMAMTGELSLLGKVMPIGGLKEKVLAARRNLVKTILIPKFNKRDLDKLDANVKEGIEFHLVSDMEEVLSLAFPADKYALGSGSAVGSAVGAVLSPEEKLAAVVAKAVAEAMKKSENSESH
ncbi:MAG: endopeptidase La [Spirochaetales bacterium]|nr:endopeptidase La [Spirochaetales bacterium]